MMKPHCINEETIGAINEAPIDAIIVPKNPPSYFFDSCFTISVAPSINRPESSGHFTILIISSISSYEMNNVNPFPALTAPYPLVFLSNLFNTGDDPLVANSDKISFAKRTSRPNNAFLSKLLIILPNALPRNPSG